MNRTLASLVRELERLVAPLASAASSTDTTLALLASFGVRPTNPASFVEAIRATSDGVRAVQRWAETPPQSPEEILALLQDARSAIGALKTPSAALELTAPAGGGEALSPIAVLLARLSYHWIASSQPLVIGLLDALGCIARERSEDVGPVLSPRISPRSVRELLRSPASHLKTVYKHEGWRDETQLSDALRSAARRLHRLSAAVGGELLGPSQDASSNDRGLVWKRRIPGLPDTAASLGFYLVPLTVDGAVSGWGVAPRGTLTFDTRIGSWNVGLTTEGTLAAFTIDARGVLFEPPEADSFGARLNALLVGDGDSFALGSENGSKLAIGTLEWCFEIGLKSGGWALEATLDFANCKMLVRPSDPDGFLAAIVGSGLEATFDIGVGWSSAQGFSVRGSGTAAVDIPVHRDLGPLAIHFLHLAAASSGVEGLGLTVGVTMSAKLGPIACSVERVGVGIQIALPDDNANLGVLDVGDPCFVPPTGAGLAIDAGGVSGGGFVEYTEADQSYAGILALNFGEIALTAIGLISTKMPDGSKGFALLIIIGVEFSPAIQLSFGFTLSGVGGLLGVNRTMVVEALRAGLKTHTLDSILFPEDPILNAPKIISDLKSVFPVQEGRYVFGPMVKIGWGSPNVIQADIGIFIELPDPIRVVLLGAITALLPEPADPIVTLHIDVLGVLEFETKTLSIDATIYDSKILTYSLYGDAALRMGWGDNPQFAMSLGGFHPKFSPPAGFPELRRLTLDLSSGSTIQLTCKMYQALTSNSLQFGARLDAHAEGGGATLDGDMSFDALIYFSPFAFTIDMAGGMTARYKGHKLGGVRLELSLSGPTPWRARGDATFEILCWDVSASFDKSWGRQDKAELPPFPAWERLQAELQRRESWGAALPGRTATEALKELDADGDAIVVHPGGTVQLRQRLLPLSLELDKVANAPIEGPREFRITRMEIGSSSSPTELAFTPLDEHFARAQFLEVSDGDKLSLPSFEKLTAGAGGTSSALLIVGAPLAFPLTYESIIIDGPNAPDPKTTQLGWTLAQRLVRRNAAARAALRAGGLSKYLVRGRTPLVRTQEPGYAVVDAGDLTPISSDDISGNDGSASHMRAGQALEKYVAANPSRRGNVMLVEAAEVSKPVASAASVPSTPEPEPNEAAILAHYYFSPAVRRGLAAAIEADATGERAIVPVRAVATPDSDEAASITIENSIELFGPGDVLGFDASVVARTDPRPNVGDFEPNFFPMIEFTTPDYPWTFSAAAPSGGAPTPGAADTALVGVGSLKPWIVLVVLEEGAEFAFGSRGADGAPPWIAVGPTEDGGGEGSEAMPMAAGSVLPDLSLASHWAHVHLTGEKEDEGGGEVSVDPAAHAVELDAQEQANPERVVSRLLCARRLKERTKYHAFVVPAFKLGLVAAGRATADVTDNALTPAWSGDTETVELPYYYHWEFGTGARGDFEHLVRLLEPRVLQKLGLRSMDCSAPGYGMPPVELAGSDGTTTSMLDLEGALASLDTTYANWGFARANSDVPGTATGLQVSLSRELLNKPVTDRAPRAIQLSAAASSGIAGVVVTLRPKDPLDGTAGFDADVEWETAANQGAELEWGATASFGATIALPAVTTGRHRVTLNGLACSATQHLRIAALNASGTLIGRTGDLTFDTPAFPLPVVVPPIYGARHVSRPTVSPPASKTTWFEELNLDPRHRAAAGYGALVVERQQEGLVASMWDQLGEIQEANELLRRGQLGREVALSVFEKLRHLSAGDFLRVTAPLHERVLVATDEGTSTVKRYVAGTRIPLAAFDPALRRVQRRRGRIRRVQGWVPAEHDDMLGRLNAGTLAATGPAPSPAGMWSLCSTTDLLTFEAPSPFVDANTAPAPKATDAKRETGPSTPDTPGKHGKAKSKRPRRPLHSGKHPQRDGKCVVSAVVTVCVEVSVDCSPKPPSKGPRFCEEYITCADLKQEVGPLLKAAQRQKLPGGMTLPSGADLEAMLDAMCGALDGFLAPDPPEDDLPPADLDGIIDALEIALDPQETVRDRVLGRLKLAPEGLARLEVGDDLRPLVGCPDFPQPMYEPLRDISQDLILPGVETVPQNTIGFLKTNGRFVEAYHLALNHAFSTEARWRGAPIDPRCTYFRQFWDVEDTIAAAAPTGPEAERALRENFKDIRRISEWGGARLGKNDARVEAAAQSDALVLLVRGDVLKKYPNTIVYAVAARGTTASPVPGLEEFSEHFVEGESAAERIFPIFSGSLGADLTFFGFPFSEADAQGETDYFPPTRFYVVLEERVSEARFGIDEAGQEATTTAIDNWDQLTWDHFRIANADGSTSPLPAGRYLDATVPSASGPGVSWSDGSAAIARITLQKPVRIAVHASKMLPKPMA